VHDHNLVDSFPTRSILIEQRAVKDRSGASVKGLHNVWITFNNPSELNAYTTDMIKEVILALRAASNDRGAVAVVITGAGSRAFCTGGNTREYAEVYAGNPGEYRQYMRLFNDMVTGVLQCDKPVICRVNGMRVGGGQEVGMACDFSVASDLALFSQAGPRHGSAPDGGSTDFLPLFVGMERAMFSCTLCLQWSAHRFYWLGGLTQIVPALQVDGQWIPNPLVVTDRVLDEYGRLVIGEWKTGADREQGKSKLVKGSVDLSLLDEAVDALCTSPQAQSPVDSALRCDSPIRLLPPQLRSCWRRSTPAWQREQRRCAPARVPMLRAGTPRAGFPGSRVARSLQPGSGRMPTPVRVRRPNTGRERLRSWALVLPQCTAAGHEAGQASEKYVLAGAPPRWRRN
jgi:6-oxo-cyclohex-1-ene-carbonyl-CoA hydrolase